MNFIFPALFSLTISWPVAAMLVALHVPCKTINSRCATLLKNQRFDWNCATKLISSADTHKEAGIWFENYLDLQTNTDLVFVIEYLQYVRCSYLNGFEWDTLMTKASVVWPERVLPLLSTIVPDTCRKDNTCNNSKKLFLFNLHSGQDDNTEFSFPPNSFAAINHTDLLSSSSAIPWNFFPHLTCIFLIFIG